MKTNLLEKVKRQAVQLAPQEQMALAEFLQKNAQKPSADPQEQLARNGTTDKIRQKEQKWIAKHRAEFAGQWVALDGETVLSHGTDGRRVYAEAKAKGVKVPFVIHIEPLDELPFGGW
jgi:hypothetical protein